MALDATRHRLLLTQQYVDSLLAVDLETGNRTPFSPKGSAGPVIDDGVRITVGETEAFLFEDQGDIRERRIVAVNLESGDRREIKNDASDGMDPVPLAGLATYEHGILVLTG